MEMKSVKAENKGKKLENAEPLRDDCDHINDSDVILEKAQVIHVQWLGGKTIPISVVSSDTIATMKDMIQDKLGIPSSMQKLKFENQLLEDGKTVAEYRIRGTIYLIINLRGGGNSAGPNCGGMQIVVKRQNGGGRPDTDTDISLEVKNSDTIQKVMSNVKTSAGIHPKDKSFYLEFNGKRLTNPNRTLSECNIRDRATLHLTRIRIGSSSSIPPSGRN
ncbi:PREDICTED: polyubiquitin-like [Nelumbo nucifera]|uniref:Polyubiquitin-like n=1 Tax=Nelumbo nucifera TaxID=4432 RepID=A0A1U7ZHS3_NELNU|nr:PREDICTED: polyubiquitin-like [Nelumbo nucifera]